MKLTSEEIGKKIKEFKPEYSKIDNTKLGNAYIRKYGPVSDSFKKDEISQKSTAFAPTQGGNSLVFDLIRKYFPQNQWQNALAVAQGESGLNPAAIGDRYPIRGVLAPSYGLFQIRALPGRPAPEQLLDPEFNVKYAANLYKQQNWRPWTVARKLGLIK